MNFRIQLGLAFAALLLANRIGAGQESIDSSRVQANERTKIEALVKDRLEKIHADSNFPGGVIAIILPDRSTINIAVGMASVEDRQPMKTVDRMMSASIGKTYFAAMAVDLIQNEKLSLDDKLAKFLGEEKWFAHIPNSSELTIAQLMRHESGIPRYIMNRQVWTDIMADPDKVWNPGDQLKYIYDAKPLHEPGKGWAYSDTNYILLGLVLEKISGKAVYEYVSEQFLVPNNLVDTIPNNQRELPGLIQGYPKMFQAMGIPDRVIVNGKFVFNPAMEWCGGGFACTPLDLARWARISFGGELLEDGYIEMMTKDAPLAPMLGPNTRYGLGVMVRKTKLGTLLGHDGGFPGYTSTMGYFPEHKIAAAFMFNSEGRQALSRPTHDVMIELVEIVANELGK